jgi:mono/diheme cytochrome c family protein
VEVWIMLAVLRAVIAAGLAFVPSLAHAQQAGNVSKGQRIVEGSCQACHRSGASRAPSFAAIGRMPSTTALSLGVYMRTSHPTMPNLVLSPAELDDVIAYVLSLKQ